MVGLPQVARRAAAAGLLALPAGCAAAQKVSHVAQASYTDAKQAVGLEAAPQPATQIICQWNRRLAPLPDPTRDGEQSAGIVGKVFLMAADNSPAAAAGDLSVVVYDETPGRPPRTPEMWHYDHKTLARLRTTDERFGPCYAVFLPWPADWKGDVTQVKLLARYQGGPDAPDLWAAEVKMAIDTSAPGTPIWTETGTALPAPTGGSGRAGFDTRGVPDPQRMIQQMKTNGPTPVPPATLPPLGGPPVGQFAPGSGEVARPPAGASGAWAGPKPAGSFPDFSKAAPTPPGGVQPIILPRRDGQ